MFRDDRFVTTHEIAAAFAFAPQFVHACWDDGAAVLEKIYRDRDFHKDPVYYRRAAGDHIVCAYRQGLINEPVFNVIGVFGALAHKLGRSCYLCHKIEHKIGSPTPVGLLHWGKCMPESLIPKNAIRLKRMSEKMPDCDYIFPKQMCGTCHQSITIRASRKANLTDYDYIDFLSKMLGSEGFQQRVKENQKNKLLHRFEI